jgi:diguanylate cyclase (GGDEF)-like protein
MSKYTEILEERFEEMEKINIFHNQISAVLDLKLLIGMVLTGLKSIFNDELSCSGIYLGSEDNIVVNGSDESVCTMLKEKLRECKIENKVYNDKHVIVERLDDNSPDFGYLGLAFLYNSITKRDARVIKLLKGIIKVAVENAKLYKMATIDNLTGLYVRLYLEQRMGEEFLRSIRYHDDFSLILFDLNDFKLVNDNYGHIAGDEILRGVGRILLSTVRSMDVAARYGGDEFAVLLPRASKDDAENIAMRIVKNIAEFKIKIKKELIGVTSCFGVASYSGDHPESPIEMFIIADKRLYQQKIEFKKDR